MFTDPAGLGRRSGSGLIGVHADLSRTAPPPPSWRSSAPPSAPISSSGRAPRKWRKWTSTAAPSRCWRRPRQAPAALSAHPGRHHRRHVRLQPDRHGDHDLDRRHLAPGGHHQYPDRRRRRQGAGAAGRAFRLRCCSPSASSAPDCWRCPVLAGSAAYAVGESRGWKTGLDNMPWQAQGFYARDRGRGHCWGWASIIPGSIRSRRFTGARCSTA